MSEPPAGVVLIVEDEPGVGELQRRRLVRAGFAAERVETVDEALVRLQRHDVSLLVLDFRLSADYSGLDFYRRLKADGTDLPVILVTGHSQEAVAIEALRAGVRDFVLKTDNYLDYLPEAVSRVLREVATEELLRQTEAQLRQSQKLEALGTLAGGIAHEFNNLLQAILGYTEYAMEAVPEDSDPHRDLTQVISAARHAAGLTRQLLGFSRRQPLERVVTEPNQLVSDLVQLLRPLIGADIEVKVALDDQVGRVCVDPGLFHQLLMNLCVNARDAMPSGGLLVIRTEDLAVHGRDGQFEPTVEPGRYIVLTVSDSGCGMSAEVKARIFEPFYTTKRVGEGTGLGLSMVYGIVTQHGGTINVYSEPNHGTTFKIYLPASESEPLDEKSSRSDSAPGGNEQILVAEDDPQVRKLVARVLTSAGYRVILAEDGAEAVRLFEENADTISLALLDVVMPHIGGRGAYGRIKEIRPDVPAILCSGYDPSLRQLDFVRGTGLTLLQKPYHPSVLLQMVREALDAELLAT